MSKRKFKVWSPDLGESAEDARTIEAHDAQDAAAEWAEWSDSHSAEYSIIKGSDMTCVVACEDHPPRTFELFGESVARYSAIEKP